MLGYGLGLQDVSGQVKGQVKGQAWTRKEVGRHSLTAYGDKAVKLHSLPPNADLHARQPCIYRSIR